MKNRHAGSSIYLLTKDILLLALGNVFRAEELNTNRMVVVCVIKEEGFRN